MSTISQWLDSYDGPDNIVAGVAQIWRRAKDEDDARPRVSAPQSVSTWLAEHRGVSDEALRTAVRTYNESRGGRQATDAEVGAFRAMNEPGTIALVPPSDQPGQPPAGPSPAMMADLGRIERVCEKLEDRVVGLAERLDDLLAWTRLQDERIKPITDLLGELAEAEQAPDQGIDPDQAEDLAAETSNPPEPPGWDGGPVGHGGPNTSHPQVTGSLWAQIAAPEPDMEAVSALGDPRLVEDEPG